MIRPPAIFHMDLGARAYELLTKQSLWRKQVREVLQFIPASRADGPRVLDLGCAYGVSTFELATALGPNAHVTGLDFSPRFIERAERLRATVHGDLANRVRFIQADATAMPFEAGRFDVAVGHSFLYLVTDRLGVLREVRRVLAPAGVVIFMEPHRDGSLASAARTGLRAVARAPQAYVADPLGTLQFATSMATWRAFSSVAGRLGAAQVTGLFEAAGLHAVAMQPTLSGLGLHAVGSA